ncbi:Pentatricopeptide repeat-containing protein [Thalictrum thalictroides]|uniref:Pentatricopeptide repeat-containing protein n=1 Tax=Thalictrum thalictroides TaxID=46969 RepID=A0A7J6XGQ3_THATH|nr:Pentatricopeptide repeat-containing protein [Thalictrum thalictroides]
MASPIYFLHENPHFYSSHLSFHPQGVNCLNHHTHIASSLARNNSLLHSKPVKLESATQVFDGSSHLKSIAIYKFGFTDYVQKYQLATHCGNININKTDSDNVVIMGDMSHETERWGGLPHRLTLIRDINQFTQEGKLYHGREYHALTIKIGLVLDKFVVTSLVSMYSKCGDMESACKLFHGCSDLDIVSYNSLISGYAINGMFVQALNIFIQAQNVGIMPNEYTFSIVLSVCGSVLSVEEGKQIHGLIVKMQFLKNTAVGNALLTMYCKCGMIKKVERLFDELPDKNHISWTAIITGLYHQERFEKALEQCRLMRQSGIIPNEHTYAIALASSGGMEFPDYGKMYHAQTIKSGMNLVTFVGTAIIDMYSRHGDMNDAGKQVEGMGGMASQVSWNALLSGYVRNGKNEEAMEAFCKMVRDGVVCDHFTYSNILNCCSSLPSLASGKQIHSQVIKTNYISYMHVASSLIEMYANCGNLAEADLIFNEMTMPDVVTWNSIIKAYSLQGCPKKALNLFRKMIEEGTKPTSGTFLTILSSCSHSGLVKEGQECFISMVQNFKISPDEKHYSCIVDLLARAGQLNDARDFVNNLPVESSASIWRPLLAACRYQKNLQMAEFVAARILDMDPGDPTVYVTLSNMYAEVGRWVDVEKQRKMLELYGIKKEPGCSWIEVDNKVYKFYSRDMIHTEMPKIYKILDILVREMKNRSTSDSNTVLNQG